jgi:hypothetical protein
VSVLLVTWIRKSPFKDQNEAIRHMVDLFAEEARKVGQSVKDEHLDMLSSECSLPPELEDQARRIIGQILFREELETEAAGCEDPKSFSNSLEWAGDSRYPNIVMLTEQVVLEGRASGIFPPSPRLHGWPLVKDQLLLWGCGLLIVTVVLVVGGLLFSR